jgi:hypothetical protein
MHGVRNCLEAIYYGCSRNAIFLRLDFPEAFKQEHASFEVRTTIDGDSNARLHVSILDGKVANIKFWKQDEVLQVPQATGNNLQASFSRILELRLTYSILAISAGKEIQLQISLWADNLPLQIMPQEGWLTLDLSEEFQSW